MISLFPYNYFKTRTALLLENGGDFEHEDATWQFVLSKLKNAVENLADGFAQIPDSVFRYLSHLLTPL